MTWAPTAPWWGAHEFVLTGTRCRWTGRGLVGIEFAQLYTPDGQTVLARVEWSPGTGHTVPGYRVRVGERRAFVAVVSLLGVHSAREAFDKARALADRLFAEAGMVLDVP